MKQTSSKTELLIESSIEALRSEHIEKIPIDCIIAESNKKLARKPIALRVSLVVSALAVGLAVIFISIPRESAAAGLKLAFEAMKNVDSWATTTYEINEDGSRTQTVREVVTRDRVIYDHIDNPDTIWHNDLHITIHEGYATKWKEEHRSRNIRNPLENLNNAIPESIKRIENFLYKNLMCTKYEFTAIITDALKKRLKCKMIFITAPETNLPLFVDFHLEGHQRQQIEYKYDLKPTDIAYELPDRVYDYDLQRKQILQLMKNPAQTAKVAGREIALHAVILDEEGRKLAIYSGSDRAPEIRGNSKFPSTNDSVESWKVSFMGYDRGWHVPVPFYNSAYSFALLSDMTAESVELPIFDGKKLTPIGWAKFSDAPSIRTGSIVYLLAPLNTLFFLNEESAAGQISMEDGKSPISAD